MVLTLDLKKNELCFRFQETVQEPCVEAGISPSWLVILSVKL